MTQEVNPPWCCTKPGGVRLTVQITPNAKKTEVVGVFGDALKLKLQAQPIEGRANEALIRFLAKTLGVSRAAIVITHGQTNRKKLIEVSSATLSPDDVAQLLAAPRTATN